jgi:hypothetical protein
MMEHSFGRAKEGIQIYVAAAARNEKEKLK